MPDSQPSYTWAFFSSQGNINGLLGGLALASLLWLPFDMPGLVLPLAALGTLEALALLYVPGLPRFKMWADRQFQGKRLLSTQTYLLSELADKLNNTSRFQTIRSTYGRMCEKVALLKRLATDTRTQLTTSEVDKLDDICLGYLRLHLYLLQLRERSESINLREVHSRMHNISLTLASHSPQTDAPALQQALIQYQQLADRHQSIGHRATAVEAILLTLPDHLEEIYQNVTASPMAQDINQRLKDWSEQMTLQSAIDKELADELEAPLPAPTIALQSGRLRSGGRTTSDSYGTGNSNSAQKQQKTQL